MKKMEDEIFGKKRKKRVWPNKLTLKPLDLSSYLPSPFKINPYKFFQHNQVDLISLKLTWTAIEKYGVTLISFSRWFVFKYQDNVILD